MENNGAVMDFGKEEDEEVIFQALNDTCSTTTNKTHDRHGPYVLIICSCC